MRTATAVALMTFPLVMLTGCALFSGGTPEPVKFTAMGCGPYNPNAEKALARFIQLDNQQATSAFMVHCGDIVTSKSNAWPESVYMNVARILSEGNQIPTFVLPGDNEWNDQADPDRGWEFWSNHFFLFDAKWEPPAPVKRQPLRPENFAFVLNKVLFIGINKVGGRVHDAVEWEQRLADNSEWIESLLESNRKRVHSAAIFAQATAEGNTDAMVRRLAAAAEKFAKPILYLHADGHKWYVKENDWAPNITHVQLDLISEQFPPVQVTVTGDPEQPFIFDRRQENALWGTDGGN